MEEQPKKENVLDKLNSAVVDLTEKVFGEQGKDFVVKTQQQVHDFNSAMIKSFVDFTDKVLESTNLTQNEIIQKSSTTVKDLLKQMDLLEEEAEEDF